MSVQKHGLNDPAFKDTNPAPNGILEVKVQARFQKGSITPQTITLTNHVHTVRWIGQRLPAGAVLQIHFPADLRGPFLDLVQSHPTVSGYGNRGPQATVERYEYEARIVAANGSSRLVGSGLLINHATEAVGDPRAGGVDAQPDPIDTKP